MFGKNVRKIKHAFCIHYCLEMNLWRIWELFETRRLVQFIFVGDKFEGL